MEHLNAEHQKTLILFARELGGADWAQAATITAIDGQGFDLSVTDGNGRREPRRVAFLEPVQEAGQLRQAFIQLADQADAPDGLRRVATARVATTKASRYLKALCNHFDRKANAAYDDVNGRVQFPFGDAEFHAEADALLLTVTAESDIMFARVKDVVADHLVRFGNKEELIVDWVDAPTA
jgi:hypothetical protein